MSDWIDYKSLRASLTLRAVLSRYGIDLKERGDRGTGPCPLPKHPGTGRSASFSAHLTRGLWNCFGCHVGGNALDLAVRMEGFDPTDTADFRRGALRVREVFGIAGVDRATERRPPATRASIPRTVPTATASDTHTNETHVNTSPVKVNEPLDFSLKDLDAEHPYLLERGFLAETIAHFGLGYCNRGAMKGRVAIPIHDSLGHLVGYAGRLTRDEGFTDAEPKYKLPGERERNGVRHRFEKSRLLYNLHRLTTPTRSLILVEGYPSVWWLWQHGHSNVVAVMGADCSPDQANLIVQALSPDGVAIVFTDGDDAGERCAAELLQRVSPYRACRWLRIDDDRQPTDLDGEELSALLHDFVESGVGR
ncbi:MAG: hypothetical protein KatS3mg104_0777 [Phycisphaerae bacterium]|nr:MAG: hypothetical protein KatS3mg104_0777 [Phycisphaerae bacterium]